MGYLKGKSALMIFDQHPEFKARGGDRHFWASGYYVDTVGQNELTIVEYIKNQYKHDMNERN
jgi:putative transposase